MDRTYALLFTDLVDSTSLNSRLGDPAMVAVWERHDAGSRELLERWRGREIDRSDGFLALFDTVEDAASFAVSYHALLAGSAEGLRARAGLHVGALTLRHNPADTVARGVKPVEVVGIAKALASRLMALARGGQTLASPAAADALATAGLRRECHGHWRLKGIDDPVEVWEVGDDSAPFIPPPDAEKAQQVVRINGQWVGLAEVPRQLPAERDTFFGREADLRTVAKRFDEGARLIVLHGPGGIGKTRLALRYGWGWSGKYPGGVYFCDLALAREIDGILHAVARGLDVPLGNEPLAQIGHVIAGRGRCLVILDNFEQVAGWAAETLGTWLDGALHARFLVTSRETLGIGGEQTVALSALATADAIALFHARARAVDTDYDVTEAAPDVMQSLVALLDGLPLALELAAARIRTMTPAQMLMRMDRRFSLLASSGGRPARQVTLRAALDWSWDLLGHCERDALQQLSVFQGGLTLESAEATLDFSAHSQMPWVPDLIQALVDKSLLRRSGARFDLLAAVQEYAFERLTTAGRQTAAASRHWRHFAALDEQQVTSERCAELENIVAACRRATAAGDIASAVDCLRLAWVGLRLTGPLRVAAQLATDLRSHPSVTPAELAMVEWVAASALFTAGALEEAGAASENGLAQLARSQASDMTAARLHAVAGEIAAVCGKAEIAAQHFSLAERHAEANAGDAQTLCHVLNATAAWATDRGSYQEARLLYERALVTAQGARDRRWEGGLLGNLGALHHVQGHLDDARRCYELALTLHRSAGDRRWEANNHGNLGLIDHAQGRSRDAHGKFTIALQMARDLGNVALEAATCCNLGLVCEAAGHLPAAAENFRVASVRAAEASDLRTASQALSYLACIQARMGDLSAAHAAVESAEAALSRVEDALARALAQCAKAEIAFARGLLAAADDAMGPARETLAREGWSAGSELACWIARIEGRFSFRG